MKQLNIEQRPEILLLTRKGKSIRVRSGETVRLGRGPENEIVLRGQGVSSQHARIEFESGGNPRLFDRGSKNGTALNGIRVAPAGSILRPGDRIQIGDTELIIAGAVSAEGPPSHAPHGEDLNLSCDTSFATDTILCFPSARKSAPQQLSAEDPEYLLALMMRSASLAAESQDPDEFFRRFIDLALEAIPARRGAVFLASEGRSLPVLFKEIESGSEASFSVSDTALASALEGGRAVLIGDREIGAGPSQSLMRLGVSFVICVPICSGSRVVGALYLDGARHVPYLSRRHLELAAALATQVGIIWENRRLTIQADRSERFATIGLVAAEVAHDLANYFTIVRITERNLDRSVAQTPDNDLREDWRSMKEALAKSYAVVSDLKSLSKKRAPVCTLASPESTVRSAIELCRQHAAPGGVELRASSSLEGFTALYDAPWMERALVNLVRNAIEASPSGAEVVVDTKLDPERGMIVFTVADAGRGIPVEDRARVLEPFFTSGKPKGTGIGLAFAHRIAVAHGGSLTFSTEAGAGTVFMLSIAAGTSRPTGVTGTGRSTSIA